MTLSIHRTLRVLGLTACLGLAVSSAGRAATVRLVYSFPGGADSAGPLFGALIQAQSGALYGTSLYGNYEYGTVYRTVPGGITIEHRFFEGPNGGEPYGGLMQALDGSFYGAATLGGYNNLGIAFKIAPNGPFTPTHYFRGGADGGNPVAAPVLASDGNLYGSTAGGLEDGGPATIYRLSNSGEYTRIHRLTPAEGLGILQPLIQATDGYLYGATSQGGDSNHGTIFKMSLDGTVVGTYSFPGGAGGASPSGVTQASDGNFYGVTQYGGNAGNAGTIFKMDPSFNVTILHIFDRGPGQDGVEPICVLVQGTDGYLYGTTVGGGPYDAGTIFRISLAGDYHRVFAFNGANGAQPVATLLQSTTGLFYGTTFLGGRGSAGTIFSLDLGLGPFVALVNPLGAVGDTVGILGQGFNSATAVAFNGTPASFTVVSDTYITALVPIGTTSGPVTVTTGEALTSSKNFTLVP